MLYQLSYFRLLHSSFSRILFFNFYALLPIHREATSAYLNQSLYFTKIERGLIIQKTHTQVFVGRGGFEPPKSYDSRFTVCPSWPLWYLPSYVVVLYCPLKMRAEERTRTADRLITNQLLYQLSYFGLFLKEQPIPFGKLPPEIGSQMYKYFIYHKTFFIYFFL
jgi:hypothetical protein